MRFHSAKTSNLCSPPVSKPRGAPKPEATQKVMTKQETTLVKVTLALGCKQRAAARFAHCTRARGVINPPGLHPRSTEKAARWWLFQESSLPRLPVSNDPRPHQSIPTQRIPVPECKNSKCALRVHPPHPHQHPLVWLQSNENSITVNNFGCA